MISAILLLLALVGHQDSNPVGVWHSSTKAAHACGVSFGSGIMGCVYLARNKVNGKGYVGKTVGAMEDRKKVHEMRASNGSMYAFHCALRKYGFDAFKWKILVEEEIEEELNNSEQVCIQMLKTKVQNGYNLTDGGDGTSGLKWSRKESRMKAHLSAKRRWNSKEERKVQSRRLFGKIRPPEVVEKVANSNRGKTRSQEAKDKISAKLKGEGNGKSYLTEAIVLTMRDLRRSGISAKQIAHQFNVPYSTVVSATNGDRWSHLPRAIKVGRA